MKQRQTPIFMVIISLFVAPLVTLFSAIPHQAVAQVSEVSNVPALSVVTVPSSAAVVSSSVISAQCGSTSKSFVNLHQSADCFSISLAVPVTQPQLTVATLETNASVAVVPIVTINPYVSAASPAIPFRIPATPIPMVLTMSMLMLLSVILRSQDVRQITLRRDVNLVHLQVLRC